ncbi:hypothetical protein EDEG_03945 [Edhazardia aedis USNM 41457]|uniref:Uncharacterized protein n=1 Tax=Edhazardia aedis (strain USNM 41457) TaxID=1003232 RepID=J9D1L5_EDHAE|nr:hypothetical protein EDEG_03945 [Edhazardia aedis USNM 41457]|eukprot:EJW01469.1 hypothetical protein EDEG_03945 [Edhazardia aedis USNM 41457]
MHYTVVAILIKKEVIHFVKEYVYLGMNFNEMLSYEVMTKYRVEKARRYVYTLKNTLTNKRVPLEYKSMLIKSVLYPSTAYGYEIYGMSLERLKKVGSILRSALGIILHRTNYCRSRALQEIDLRPVAKSTSMARARLAIK